MHYISGCSKVLKNLFYMEVVQITSIVDFGDSGVLTLH